MKRAVILAFRATLILINLCLAHDADPAEIADAQLPSGANLDWEKASITVVNTKRAQIELNGIWRFAPAWILNEGAEIGADGLIGRKSLGHGVAVFCQIDPESLQADEKTYFRYTRWRAARAVAPLLANLGARLAVDSHQRLPGGASSRKLYKAIASTDAGE